MANTIDANVSVQAANGYSLIVVTYSLDGADFTPDYLEISDSNKMSDLSPLRFPGTQDKVKNTLTFNVYLKYTPPKLTVNFGALVGSATPESRELTPTTTGTTTVDGSFFQPTPNNGIIVLDANDATVTGGFAVKATKQDASILHLTSDHFSHLLNFIKFTSNQATIETFTEPRLETDPEYVHVFMRLPASESSIITAAASSLSGFKPGITDLIIDYAPNKKAQIAEVMIIDLNATTKQLISPYVSTINILRGDNKFQIFMGTQTNNNDEQFYCILQKPDMATGDIKLDPEFSVVGSSDGKTPKELLLDNTSLPIDYSKFSTPFYMNAYTAAVDVGGNVFLSPGEPFMVVIDPNDPPIPPQDGMLTAPTLSAYSPIVNNNVDGASPVKANATLGQILTATPTAVVVEFFIYVRGYDGPNVKNDIITTSYPVNPSANLTSPVTADFDVNKLKGYDSAPNGSPSQMKIQYRVISSSSQVIYSAITNYQIDTKSPFLP